MEWGLGCGKDSYRPGQLQAPDEMGRSRQVHPSNLYHSGAATTFSGTDILPEARNKGGELSTGTRGLDSFNSSGPGKLWERACGERFRPAVLGCGEERSNHRLGRERHGVGVGGTTGEMALG